MKLFVENKPRNKKRELVKPKVRVILPPNRVEGDKTKYNRSTRKKELWEEYEE